MWSVLPFFTKNGYVLEGSLTTCTFDYISRDFTSRSIVLSMFIGGFVIPFFIIVFVYYCIWVHLKNRYFELQQQEQSLVSLNIRKSSSNHSNYKYSKSESMLEKCHITREYKAIKIMLIFLSMFCIAWLPYAVVALYAQYGDNIERFVNVYTVSIPNTMAKAGSVYNPIVYIVLNKDCREHYKRFLIKK